MKLQARCNNMQTIFELSSQYQAIMDRINEIDEIDDNLMDLLISINDDLETKILNYAAIIKEIEAKAEAIAKAMANMEKRFHSLDKSAERLRQVVKYEMQKCEKKKVENAYHQARLVQNNPKVCFTDKSLIPDEFLRKKIQEIVEPNTSLISKALKENVEVPGAFLVKEQRLEIR